MTYNINVSGRGSGGKGNGGIGIDRVKIYVILGHKKFLNRSNNSTIPKGSGFEQLK